MPKLRQFIQSNRLLVLTALVLYVLAALFATYSVFSDMANVNGAVATCYGVLLGVPATAGLWAVWNKKDEQD